MTTYINRIVQITRQMHDEASPDYPALSERRGDLILQAIRDPNTGIERDKLIETIRWAIGMNDAAAKVQMQMAMAHTVAAIAIEEGES